MCQHSWYDKNRRRYGPKPNTRRERGLKRRDLGIAHGPKHNKPIETLQAIDKERNVKEVEIPRSMTIIKRYVKIYNWYVQHYEKCPDAKLCLAQTADKFNKSLITIKKAIDVCKYILATTDVE